MSSPLDRWNPLTPLAASLFLVTAAYTGPAPWTAAAALGLALLAARWSGAGRRVAALAAIVGVPTILLLVVLDVAGEPATARALVPALAPALVRALAVAVPLTAAVAALGWVVTAVPPRRLTRALAARGLPAWLAYVLVASLEAVPDARRRAGEVLDAQRARGLAVGGGVRGRVRALLPLAGPLVVSLVTESEQRALALDARAFDPRRARTALVPIPDPPRERVLRALIWTALLVLLVWVGIIARWPG